MIRRTALLACMVAGVASPAAAQIASVAMPGGSGSFEFRDAAGDPAKPLKVWYSRPEGSIPASRVVFLLHGSSRTGEQALSLGAPFARANNAVLIAPEFSQEHYPDEAYDFGGMTDAGGQLRSEHLWTLSVIEHLFDAVRQATPVTEDRYDIVGHSAGGQFVHRLVLFVPGARFRRAVVSSPGRYAFPVQTVAFPYGLGGSRADEASLRAAFGRDVVVILGDKDVDDQTRAWEPQTIAQGRNRFARGLGFFAAAAEAAFDLGVPLAWRLRIADGIDHNPPRMVRAALQLLLE